MNRTHWGQFKNLGDFAYSDPIGDVRVVIAGVPLPMKHGPHFLVIADEDFSFLCRHPDVIRAYRKAGDGRPLSELGCARRALQVAGLGRSRSMPSGQFALLTWCP